MSVGEALLRALQRSRNREVTAVARDRQNYMHLEQIAGAVLVMQVMQGPDQAERGTDANPDRAWRLQRWHQSSPSANNQTVLVTPRHVLT